MIVNLYVDRMMTTPPESMYDVWDATKSHAAVYSTAAARIGLTPAEYKEFRKDLLEGKAVYLRLPQHVDAMAGVHHHQVYALKNVQMRGDQRGWAVGLADGTQVFVPSTCGNLSMVHKPKPFHAVAAYQVTKQPVVIARPKVPVTEVSFVPPVPIDTAPLSLPVAHPVAWWAFVPLVAGIATGLSGGGGGGGTPVIPPCSGGSTSMGVCHQGSGADYGN